MNFPDNLPTFEMSPPRFATTDAIDVRVQFPMKNESFDSHSHLDQAHLAKRVRTSENDNNSPRMMMVNPPNPAMNKGTSHIFFKTRMCVKFKQGACRNGENCNFAHGVEDMRHPPPNWEELVGRRSTTDERSSGNWDEDHRIIQKMKICKKFYNGEECPYGDRCSFLHEDPGKFRDDSSALRFRESSAISIGTNGSPPIIYGDGSKLNDSEGGNRGLNNGGLNGSRGIVKSTFWKTKLCIKWETTGHCPFGVECHFAHGQAELQVPYGRIEAEAVGAISTSTKATIPTLPNVASSVHLNDANSINTISIPQTNEEKQVKKSLLKWKGLNKINRIYGDWIDDDFPLSPNLPGGVES